MYELVSVIYPFTDAPEKGKLRPGFILSPPFGKHRQVVVAYVTTQTKNQLATDILLEPAQPYFPSTGLKRKSLIKLHRLSTFQPTSLRVGEGSLPDEIIVEVKEKLRKVFRLDEQ